MVKQIISGDLTFEGVGCIQCHLIKAVDPNVKGHPSVKLDPGRTVFGGYKDFLESKAHDSQYLDIFKQSDLFLACHTVVLPGALWAEAVGGWRGAKHATEGRDCRTCHLLAACE